eukprot:gene3746-biopygen3074
MSINKSQGQTLRRVGVNLQRPCFTHGMLYVALSRVGDSTSARVLLPAGFTAGHGWRADPMLPRFSAPLCCCAVVLTDAATSRSRSRWTAPLSQTVTTRVRCG